MNRVALIVAAVIIAGLAIAWRTDRAKYGSQRFDDGKAEVQAQWDASVVKATADALVEEERRRLYNASVLEERDARLAAAAGRADDLERRLRRALARSCSSGVPQAGSQPGASVGVVDSGSDESEGGASEIVARMKRYDAACLTLIEDHSALIKEVKPQM